MPTKQRPMTMQRLDSLWGLTERGKTRKARRDARDQRRAARSAARAEHAATPTIPALPDLNFLTTDDRQRVTRALGVDMPMPEGWHGLQPDTRLSAKLSERYLVDLERWREHERSARAAELAKTAIDGATAKPEDVTARLSAMGLDPVGLGLHFERPGRALEPPPAVHGARIAHSQANVDMQIAQRVNLALQRGERVDCRQLTAGEMRALMQLRGTG